MSRFDRGRLVTTWGIDGALSMGIDAALLEAAEAAPAPATLRFSTWTPPAVSIGRFQDAAAAVDGARAAEAGCDVVRRPTGGRAVLHDGDLVYSIVARHDDPALGGRRGTSLRAIADALADALAALGVAVERAAPAAAAPRAAGAAPPCFASAAREELRAGGRKLLGSARLEGRVAFLQHGSLAIARSPARLADLLPAGAAERAAVAARLAMSAVSLEDALGAAVAAGAAAHALRAAFERRAGRRFVDEPLTARESRRARALAASFVTTAFAAAAAPSAHR
jgi:lipoate-protein ligase A